MSRRMRLDWLSSGNHVRRPRAPRKRLAIPYSRRLRIEPLEERQLLAIMVNTLVDEADGSIIDGDVSLRDAIALAPSGDTISFSVTGTIGLSLGQLTINKNLTIAGLGAGVLTIDQNTPGSRVFNIDDGNATNDKTVSISGLTLTGGNVSGDQRGGAIQSRENLTLTACTIRGNEATESIGGGISQFGGTLAISASTIEGNTARIGGGLSMLAGHPTIASTITSSTISGNVATGLVAPGSSHYGGGIMLGVSNMVVTNSTVSGNKANDQGGGISVLNSGNLIVRHSTITGNTSGVNDGADFGGGIVIDSYSVATLDHTIVAGNLRGAGATRDDLYGGASARFSLIGDNTRATITDNGGNQIGTGDVPINSLLGVLASNGGPTWTHVLLAASPAIDAGDVALRTPPTNDQRGAPFSRIADGDATSGAWIDIGAYERQSLIGLSLAVDTLIDESDGNYSLGDLSLREAIGLANGSLGVNTITFAAPLSGATITLGGTELAIGEALTIDARSLAENLTIDASQASRIFNITATTSDFMLGGLILTGGRTTGNDSLLPAVTVFRGGAIRSLTTGNLTLDQSTVSGNSTEGNFAEGGGIFSRGSLTLTQSTVSGNSTAGFRSYGGGISASSVTLTQSTVSGNSTTGDRAYVGGIWAIIVTLTGSTVSGNSTAGSGAWGGGISAVEVTLAQSTVSGNSTAGDGADGGGIRAYKVTLTRSTVSGNSTAGDRAHGAGIRAYVGILTQSTVTDNHALHGTATGGGVFQVDSNPSHPFSINGSIVAGNTAGSGGADLMPDPQGALAINYSLVGFGITPIGGVDNIVSNTPMLGPLADNGGRTQTHALLPASPAIDAGDATILFNPAQFDARGAPFVRVFDGGSGGARIDIGAYERQTVSGLHLGVDTAADENDGDYLAGDLSLREAIGLANGSVGPDTITFATSLAGQTILLNGKELFLTEALTIDARPLAESVTIDADEQSRIFNITAITGNFTLGGLMLTGGRTATDGSSGTGGAIRSLTLGNLTLDQCTVSGNSTAGSNGQGGGIWARDLTLTKSAVNGNRTEGTGASGGGIRADLVRLTESTVSGNNTTGSSAVGGGIFAQAVILTNSTVSGNHTSGSSAHGGGVYAFGGPVTFTQATISGNSTTGIGAYGGGIWAFDVTLTQSTVGGNSTTGEFARGGGVFAVNALTLTQSTVTGNSTMGSSAHGGGIAARTMALSQSTVTGNRATNGSSTGGGLFQVDSNPSQPFLINGSIVAGNTAIIGVDIVPDPQSPLTVYYSLIGTTPAGIQGVGNIMGNATGLGPLANNGGPTQTHALLAGSPAINAGDPAAVAGLGGVPLHDQRGGPFSRLSGGRIDIGAFEVQSIPPALRGDFNGDGVVNALDIDLLAADAARATSLDIDLYDLNGDRDVTFVVSSPGAPSASDSDVLIRDILHSGYGDADLNGQVFLSDLTRLATNYRRAGLFGWAEGNFNGSQEAGNSDSPRVFLADLIALATHWRLGVVTGSASGAAVPEPEARSETAAARAASIGLTETPAGLQGSRPSGVVNRYRRADLGGNDLLLVALDRARFSARQVVTTADYRNSVQHTEDGDSGSLIDSPHAVALATWP